ncbi:MAG: phosphoribosyltransferase [Emcibacteraceae bacterium]
MHFLNRAHAGKELAKALSAYSQTPDTIILGLPRGGVPIAYEIARALSLPFDILLVRKLGVPGHEELAMGAIAEGNILYINQDIISSLQIPHTAIEGAIVRETQELKRRSQLYRSGRPSPNLKGMTVIIVDDGLATGATMHAAVMALKQTDIKKVVVAVPVGAVDTIRKMEDIADKVICLFTPDPFYGVGNWYNDFSQTTDQEVQELLTLNSDK